MRSVLSRPRAAAALLLLPALAACGGDRDAPLALAVIGDSAARSQPGVRLLPADELVRGATAQGLVGFDELGRVIPALADRWIVTDDGLSYIFRLREGNWANGTPLSGATARTALRRAIDAQRNAPLGQDVAGIEEIRTMAGRVIELRLAAPNPDLLQVLAQPEFALIHDGLGTGPYRLIRRGKQASLVPVPPARLGLPQPEKREAGPRAVALSVLPAARAVERFRDGDVDVVLGGGFGDFPLTTKLGLARGSLQADPVIGLFGLAFAHGDGFLATLENREAVALAIDRDALAKAMGVSGWALSTRIVSAGMEGDSGTIGERWSNLSLDQRRAAAAARVGRWSAARPIRLRIALPLGPGADVLFSRLSEDLAAVGLTAVRVREGGEADLRLVDRVARYARANWFLARLSCAARQGLCSPAADALAARARAATDPAARGALLAEAETTLTAANVYVPLGAPLRWALVRGNPGYSANRFGIHPLMSLAARTR